MVYMLVTHVASSDLTHTVLAEVYICVSIIRTLSIPLKLVYPISGAQKSILLKMGQNDQKHPTLYTVHFIHCYSIRFQLYLT